MELTLACIYDMWGGMKATVQAHKRSSPTSQGTLRLCMNVIIYARFIEYYRVNFCNKKGFKFDIHTLKIWKAILPIV